jgi:hypothetical protein
LRPVRKELSVGLGGIQCAQRSLVSEIIFKLFVYLKRWSHLKESFPIIYIKYSFFNIIMNPYICLFPSC